MERRERVPADVLAEMHKLTENWNNLPRVQQVINRHRIHDLSGIPNGEYTASWSDMKELLNQHAALVEQRDGLARILSMTICHGCNNRIGWSETPSKYGDWRECSSCKAARAALATVEQGGEG